MIVYQLYMEKTNSIYIGKYDDTKENSIKLMPKRGKDAYKLMTLYPAKIQKVVKEYGRVRLYFQPVQKVKSANEADRLIKQRKVKAEKFGRTVL